MLEFIKPTITAEVSEDGRTGSVVISPLSRGYGLTLGNAIRRVLLNSIPGTAATEIVLYGDDGLVLHEFTTMPGVKEDVTEIILNVKGICAKLNDKSCYKAVIDVIGPCEVTDACLNKEGVLQVLNPDHHIATVEEGHKFYMEVVFDHGAGYVTNAENKAKAGESKIGVLYVDSIFTPVRQVGYTVENTRHESVDGYEKLTVNITTTGVQTVDQAVAYSGSILTQLFNVVGTLSDCEVPFIGPDSEKTDSVLDTPIEDLNLSVRSYNCLKRAGINTVKELISRSSDDLYKIRNFGKKSFDEITLKLKELGLSFAGDAE